MSVLRLLYTDSNGKNWSLYFSYSNTVIKVSSKHKCRRRVWSLVTRLRMQLSTGYVTIINLHALKYFVNSRDLKKVSWHFRSFMIPEKRDYFHSRTFLTEFEWTWYHWESDLWMHHLKRYLRNVTTYHIVSIKREFDCKSVDWVSCVVFQTYACEESILKSCRLRSVLSDRRYVSLMLSWRIYAIFFLRDNIFFYNEHVSYRTWSCRTMYYMICHMKCVMIFMMLR